LVRRRVPQPSDSEVSTLIDPATGLPSESTSMSFSDNGRTALEDEPVPFTLARYLSGDAPDFVEVSEAGARRQ
jgi:hypothetical protein